MVTWVVGPTFRKNNNKQTSQVAPFAKKRSELETGEPFVNGVDIYGSCEIYYSNFSKRKNRRSMLCPFFFTQSVHLHFKHLLEKKKGRRRKKERQRERKKARGLALFTGDSLPIREEIPGAAPFCQLQVKKDNEMKEGNKILKYWRSWERANEAFFFGCIKRFFLRINLFRSDGSSQCKQCLHLGHEHPNTRMNLWPIIRKNISLARHQSRAKKNSLVLQRLATNNRLQSVIWS